jgi:hypothetical protein
MLRLAARQRRRLAWRHFLPLALALLTMLVCAVGIDEAIWPSFRRLVGDRPDTVSARWQVWAGIYVGASILASFAAARFDIRLALQRFPLVFLLACVERRRFSSCGLRGRFVFATGDDSNPGGSADSAVTTEGTAGPPRPPRNLAAALLGPADAELALGAPVGATTTSGNWVTRSASICRYQTLENSAFLTFVLHGKVSGWLPARLSQRGEPLPGVGDFARYDGHILYARAGDYLLTLSAWRRDQEQVDRGFLVAVVEHLIDRLPLRYEVDDAELELFSAGWRGRLNSLFVLLGLPILHVPSRSAHAVGL